MSDPVARPPVEALLFDLGGVVMAIDFDRAVAGWERAAGLEPGALRGRFTMDAAYERHERGELATADYLAHLRMVLAVDLDDDALAAAWNDIFLDALPGVPELLVVAAERLPLYAFTNTNHLHRSAWEARFARQFAPFRYIFSSADLGLRKPEEAAFRHVATEIGVPLEHILFLDDTEENVCAAADLGLQTVHVRTAADVHAALAPLGIQL